MPYTRTRKSDLVEKLTEEELKDYNPEQEAWEYFEDWKYWEEEPETDPSYLRYVV